MTDTTELIALSFTLDELAAAIDGTESQTDATRRARAIVHALQLMHVEPRNSHQGSVVGDGRWAGVCADPNHPEAELREFEGQRPNMTQCMNCWYTGEMGDADARFKPLADIVREAGFRAEVEQTGGMVMCLGIYPEGSDYGKAPYALMADPDYQDEGYAFSLYVQTEDTCEDLTVYAGKFREDLLAALARWDHWVALAKTKPVPNYIEMLDVNRRRELADTPVTIDGKDAVISGVHSDFAHVRALPDGAPVEFAWSTVNYVVTCKGGDFRSSATIEE